MVINLAEKMEGFVPGVTYTFDPPQETNCIAVSGQAGWMREIFSEGWCLKFENGLGIFQGKPAKEGKVVFFFKIEYGPGSIAREKPKEET